MAPPFPSIQSFFQIQSSPKSSPAKSSSSSPLKPSSSAITEISDGFTSEEIEAVLHPKTSMTWIPRKEYAECDIGSLPAGPNLVVFMGRVISIHDQATVSKRPRAAKGCLKLIIRDDTGAVTVRLWFANALYDLHMGHLVTVWTSHISNGEAGTLAPSSAPLFTSIFPERDSSCYLMKHENSDVGTQFRTPQGYRANQPLARLMTLKNFVDGGYDVADGRMLVCVKSIGPRKQVTNKNGTTSELVNVGLFDNTAEASLTLYGVATASAASWKPCHTTLLITNPRWRIERKTWLSFGPDTHVEIDPCIADADWLRSFAQRLTKREHVNPPFPDGIFDVEAAQSSDVRVFYTLAEVDEFVRAAPQETFVGYLSLIVAEVKVALMHRRQMLMCNECCGVPLYANSTTAMCQQCDKPVALSLNPRIIGPLIDETGCVASGKLIFSEDAWLQLLGRSAEQLADCEMATLRYLEQRLVFLRLTFCFGWVGEVSAACEPSKSLREEQGRLCIWAVKA